jgi:hypothetical protein
MGHQVFIIDPRSLVPNNRWTSLWIWRTGGIFMEAAVTRRILSASQGRNFDLVYVDGGELIGPSLVAELKRRFSTVINYNVDDPYGTRDGQRWRLYLKSVPFYDLVTVVREENVHEASLFGAKKVLKVFRSADEIAHAPRDISADDRHKWGSEVLFLGTWMPERGPFLASLVNLGVPLAIYGDRWQKAAEWPILRKYWRGSGLHSDDDYARAIQCASICLGLLSKYNRDLHTQRSLEIPYLGGLLCAERTAEHLSLYEENEEAVFWSSAEECAAKCFQLLEDEQRRAIIAHNGRARCIKNGTLNQPIISAILQSAARNDGAK